MPTASPKPSIIGAGDDEPNHLARKRLDAVHVGNDAPRTILARGPATCLRLCYRPHYFHAISGPRDALSSSCLDAASNG